MAERLRCWAYRTFATAVMVVVTMTAVAGQCLATEQKTFNLEAGLWFGQIAAKGRYYDGAKATDADLKGDVGIKDTALPWLRADWRLGPRTHIRADYFSGHYFGDASRIEQVELFGGLITRDVKYELASDLKLSYWKAGIVHYLHSTPARKFGIMINVNSAAVEARERLVASYSGSLLYSQEQDLSTRITAPTLGLIYEASVNPNVKYYVQTSGFALGTRPFFFDGEAGVNCSIGRGDSIHLTAGYRLIRYASKQSEKPAAELASFKLAGPFFGLKVQY